MQWWCSAVGVPWAWSWRAYPGVWLFVLVLALAYVWLLRRTPPATGAARPGEQARPGFFLAGLLLLWVALDWPVGALGAGYLASVHMLQFILIGMAAPPLLLLGLPGRLRAAPAQAGAIRRVITHPLVTLVAFTAVVIATHMPLVTDTLMPTQAGSFLIDTLWLGAGLLYWWPVLADTGRVWFGQPVKIGYLFVNMVLMTAPGAMITFADLPIYATFELAPPIPGVSALDDQRMAGLAMRFGGSLVLFPAMSILFYRWSRAEQRLLDDELVSAPEGPAQPGV